MYAYGAVAFDFHVGFYMFATLSNWHLFVCSRFVCGCVLLENESVECVVVYK